MKYAVVCHDVNSNNDYLIEVEDLKYGTKFEYGYTVLDVEGKLTEKQANQIVTEIDKIMQEEDSEYETFSMDLVEHVVNKLGYTLNLKDITVDDVYYDIRGKESYVVFTDDLHVGILGDIGAEYYTDSCSTGSYKVTEFESVDFDLKVNMEKAYVNIDEFTDGSSWTEEKHTNVRVYREDDNFIIVKSSAFGTCGHGVCEVLHEEVALHDYLEKVDRLKYLDDILSLKK